MTINIKDQENAIALDLSGNMFQNNDMETLMKDIAGFKKLKKLTLRDCNLFPVEIYEMSKKLSDTTIEVLDLSQNNNLTYKPIEDLLLKNPQIKELISDYDSHINIIQKLQNNNKIPVKDKEYSSMSPLQHANILNEIKNGEREFDTETIKKIIQNTDNNYVIKSVLNLIDNRQEYSREILVLFLEKDTLHPKNADSLEKIKAKFSPEIIQEVEAEAAAKVKEEVKQEPVKEEPVKEEHIDTPPEKLNKIFAKLDQDNPEMFNKLFAKTVVNISSKVSVHEVIGMFRALPEPFKHKYEFEAAKNVMQHLDDSKHKQFLEGISPKLSSDKSLVLDHFPEALAVCASVQELDKMILDKNNKSKTGNLLKAVKKAYELNPERLEKYAERLINLNNNNSEVERELQNLKQSDKSGRMQDFIAKKLKSAGR